MNDLITAYLQEGKALKQSDPSWSRESQTSFVRSMFGTRLTAKQIDAIDETIKALDVGDCHHLSDGIYRIKNGLMMSRCINCKREIPFK